MTETIDNLIKRASVARALYNQGATQKRYDVAAQAAAWVLLKPENNKTLAEQAVKDTGLGNVKDKITKNHRKTLGLLQDIKNVKTCGIIEDDKKSGLTKIARPVGVIGAVVPSTNPLATPVHNIVNALKCGNAIIISPSPKGAAVGEKLIGLIRQALKDLELPEDLVQITPLPPNKEATQALLEKADVVIVTGSQDNVRRAYSSGSPALGVGAGNVSVIIDETADVNQAAEKITASKCFDNATSCSSENAIVLCDGVYDDAIKALAKCGGILLSKQDGEKVKKLLRKDGVLHRDALAQDASKMAAAFGISLPEGARFVMVEEEAKNISPDNPLCLEKMSLVATLFKAADFVEATNIVENILNIQGAGHSIGLHTADDKRAVALGESLPACRVIVNQAHCFATGGAFNNGMKFSLSMGCGSWGGNSIDDNLHYRHFMNIVKIVRPIAENMPEVDDMLAEYISANGGRKS